MLYPYCWGNCNNRGIQVINSDEDDDGEPKLPDDLVEASLSLHVEEDTSNKDNLSCTSPSASWRLIPSIHHASPGGSSSPDSREGEAAAAASSTSHRRPRTSSSADSDLEHFGAI
ncbi:hypothetical protein AVEN_19070-1 [Araneus ventricosus]|uniref:Uncharacterized protein n=1 Tax=Araneus ventricosus TaxID=182803 RepID=A0A4Y2R7H2_ARAVE|nr:hypothetical protein AVEN_19070-1 [Araneus ventricosus]